MAGGIYTITNTENHKVYIGSTIRFRKRWIQHRGSLRREQHSNLHLQRAWNKYGEDAFEFSVLEYLDNPEELHLAEQFWMDVYRLEGKQLYNYGLAARSPMLGRCHTEETRAKISSGNLGKISSLRGRTLSEETKKKMSAAQSGKTRTEEHCFNLSAALKGRVFSEEHKRKLYKTRKKNGMYGKHHTKESCTKIGNANGKLYPAFTHQDTGEIIPAGVNLSAMCRRRGLNRSNMRSVMIGKYKQHKGWILKTNF